MGDIFTPDVLNRAVHDTLEEAYAALPDGKNHAVLIDASTDGGVRALFVQRVGGGWQISAEGDWKGGNHVAGKISAIKAW